MSVKKTKARHFAFKFLYQFFYRNFDIHANEHSPLQFGIKDLDLALGHFLESYTEPDEEHPQNLLLPPDLLDFAKQLLLKTIHERSTLLAVIDEQTDRKKMKEPTLVTVILLLGACEIKFFRETPRPVVINEMVDLARAYGSDDISRLVNGVLDKIQ
jgi:transcription termination factor NusB